MPKNDTLDALHRLTNQAWTDTRITASVSGEASRRLMEHIRNAKPIKLSEVLKQQEETPPPPPELPDAMNFQTGSITFSQAPVGGGASLKLYKNGNYEFWGHFHDSGFPSYDAGLVWVIVGQDGTAFTFARKVHLCGTLEAGSRDGDWDDNGNNAEIANHWPALVGGYHYRWTANVNWDWGIMLKQVEDALKAAGTIISGVVAVVALL
jgi:hypothetical protein